MKCYLTITAIFVYHLAFSQVFRDTAYLKKFESFVRSTQLLINQSHRFLDSTKNPGSKSLKDDSLEYYTKEINITLRNLDSMHTNSLYMAEYFEDGKRSLSRDFTSPIAQLQCSFFYFMGDVRRCGGNKLLIAKASLILESHLQKGFPSSDYCPFVYDSVRINPGTPK